MSSRQDNVATQVEGGHEERHEIKFAAYALEYARVRQWLLLHSAGFRAPYPDRQVNNVYFDTWDYRAFAENLAGVSERSKVRFRWYGDSSGPAAGSLEVKQKRNHFGWKLRFPVATAPWEEGRGWNEIRSALREQIAPDARMWLDQNPLPIMINRYERQYFVSGDGLIRATIDVNQRVYDQRYGTLPNFTRQAVTQDTLVVEFKFAREDRQKVVAMLQGFPLRIGRHSKFMNAVRSIAMLGY